jgi:hypothetical protein
MKIGDLFLANKKYVFVLWKTRIKIEGRRRRIFLKKIMNNDNLN